MLLYGLFYYFVNILKFLKFRIKIKNSLKTIIMIRRTVKKQIGKQTLHYQCEGKTFFQLELEVKKLSFGDVTHCGICKSDNLDLNARLTEDNFEYVEVKCLACKAALVFGQPKKEKETYYLRRKKDGTREYDWQPFVPSDEPTTSIKK